MQEIINWNYKINGAFWNKILHVKALFSSLFTCLRQVVSLMQEDYKLEIKSKEPFETKSFMLWFHFHLFYLFDSLRKVILLMQED